MQPMTTTKVMIENRGCCGFQGWLQTNKKWIHVKNRAHTLSLVILCGK